MTQLNFLNDHDGLSRTSDILPSHAAGEEFVKEGKAHKHHEMILKVMPVERQMTNMQIAQKALLSQAQVARRMIELHRRDLIYRGEIVVCPVLHRLVGTWIKKCGVDV